MSDMSQDERTRVISLAEELATKCFYSVQTGANGKISPHAETRFYTNTAQVAAAINEAILLTKNEWIERAAAQFIDNGVPYTCRDIHARIRALKEQP